MDNTDRISGQLPRYSSTVRPFSVEQARKPGSDVRVCGIDIVLPGDTWHMTVSEYLKPPTIIGKPP